MKQISSIFEHHDTCPETRNAFHISLWLSMLSDMKYGFRIFSYFSSDTIDNSVGVTVIDRNELSAIPV